MISAMAIDRLPRANGMNRITVTIEQLREMIGVQVWHDGMRCEILEVLEDGPSLILVSVDSDTLQSDQFGNPSRRVPQTHTVPVLTSDGTALHPAFLALDLIDQP